MKPHILVLVAACVLAIPVLADNPTPYAGQQTGTIKALSDEDITALLKGDGMGFAKVAELNGYPGPKLGPPGDGRRGLLCRNDAGRPAPARRLSGRA
jgi:hypothetical protein